MTVDSVPATWREVAEELRRRANGPRNPQTASVMVRAADMLEELTKALDTEAARWQERIADTIKRSGLEPFDASGNDSGDPLDWTDDQVRHALEDLRDRANRAGELHEAEHAVHVRLHQAAAEYFHHNSAEHEDPGCPEDDTCSCRLVNAVNEAFAGSLRYQPDKIDSGKDPRP